MQPSYFLAIKTLIAIPIILKFLKTTFRQSKLPSTYSLTKFIHPTIFPSKHLDKKHIPQSYQNNPKSCQSLKNSSKPFKNLQNLLKKTILQL